MDYPDCLTSISGVARQVGLSPSRVRSLIRSGEVNAVKIDGRWLVPPFEVLALMGRPRSAGRPWNPERALAFLRSKPDETTLRDRLSKLRRRAAHYPFNLDPERRQAVLNDPRIALSGVHCAGHYGAPVLPERAPIDAYISEHDAPAFISDHGLDPYIVSPDVWLHVVAGDQHPNPDDRYMPIAFACVELAERHERETEEALWALDLSQRAEARGPSSDSR